MSKNNHQKKSPSKKEVSFELASPFKPCGDQPQAIAAILSAFKKGEKFQTLLGVTGSGKTFTVANIIQGLGKPVLVLAPNKTLAAQLFAEFKEFFPHNAVEYFVSYYDYYQPEAYIPSSDTFIEKDSSINDEIDKMRHSATRSLMERKDVIVVASVSCIYGIGSPEDYKENRIVLFQGETRDRDEFLKELVAIQFSRNDLDFGRGTFRVRGDIVEVFPAYESAEVIRVEFFDDTVETISLVDPLRGKVVRPLNKIAIYPSSHYVVGENRMKQAMATIREELRNRIAELDEKEKILEKERIKQRTLLDLEMMEEIGYCSGIENYSRHLTLKRPGEPPPTLIDFFLNNFLLVIDESHMSVPQVGGMFNGDRSRKMTLVEHGFRLPSALDNRPLNFTEFENKLDQVLFVSATPGPYELKKTGGEYVEQIIRPTGLLDPQVEFRDAATQVDDLLVEVKKTVAAGFRVLVTTLTKRLSEEITSYYKGLGLKVRYLHSEITTLERLKILKELRLGVVDILVGINLLREGLDLPEVALVAILDADKEGFLRSTNSLIQTIGRAARNSQGRVILYGYKETPSTKMAMAETLRRRKLQEDYNKKNHIVPATISKKIYGGVMEVLQMDKVSDREQRKRGELRSKLADIGPKDLDARVKELTSLMKAAAKRLEFEEAARLRDEIAQINELRLLL